MLTQRTLQTGLLVLASVVLFATCEPRQTTDPEDETRFVQIERQPGNAPPSKEAEGLREAPLIDGSVTAGQQAKDPECPFSVDTFVRAETGTDCNSYRAEIAGTVSRCVTECDEKLRFAEAVASAQMTCADFCKKKKCAGPRYQPPEKCAVSRCLDARKCPANCPKLNTCNLLQGQRVWNCICLEA